MGDLHWLTLLVALVVAMALVIVVATATSLPENLEPDSTVLLVAYVGAVAAVGLAS